MFHNVKELNNFDTIVVDRPLIKKISELFKDEGMLPFLGILNEGVIKYIDVDPNTTQFIYFKDHGKQENEHIVELQNYVFHTKRKNFMHVFTAKIDYFKEKRVSEIKFGIFFAARANKESRRLAFNETEATFMAVFGYIHMLKDNRKTIVKYKDNEPISNSNNKSYNPSKRNVIEIEDISVIVRSESSDIISAFKRQFNRHTESWTVMGHPRHYKDGKVVWIKPYTKGDKNSIKAKDYKVIGGL